MARPKLIYLDHAAATPMDPAVAAAMRPFFTDRFYNPSATYAAARQVAQAIKSARTGVAATLGVKAGEIIFTAGGTEANNLALEGVAAHYPKAEIISTHIEHESILEPLHALKDQGRKIRLIKPDPTGLIQPQSLAKALNGRTVLVSVIYANNEIGAVQPLRQIAEILRIEKQRRLKSGNSLPLYLHSDACQAGAYLSLQAHRLGVDLMTLNGGKIYGPKQSGVLFISSQVKIDPLIRGGGQERGLRSGTENVPAIIGFAKALALAQSRRAAEARRIEDLQTLFFNLVGEKLPAARINGSLNRRLPNNVHLSFPGQDNERLQIELDERGIECGLGSACSALKQTPSHVLKAIGLDDAVARASLRFTLGRSTSEAQVRHVVKTLASLIA